MGLGSLAPLVGAAIGGFIAGPSGAMAGATAGAGFASAQGAADANATNIALGREQMQFQTEMSNTAYQRAVKDMRAAGLNPALAYQMGGASSPVGSLPQVSNAAAPLASGAASAVSAYETGKQLELVQAQVDNAKTSNVLLAEQAAKTMEEGKQAAIDTVIKRNTAQAIVDRAVAEASSARSASYLKGNEIPKSELYSDAWRGANALLDSVVRGGSSALEKFRAPVDGKSFIDETMNRFRNVFH